MNKILKISVIFLLFISYQDIAYSNDINFNFNSIFEKAKTEEGKKDMVPTYKGTNIPETNINGENIDNEIYKNLENNEAGKLINNSFNTRPQYDTKQLGNIVDNTDNSIKNSENIVNKDYCDPYNDIEYKVCYKYYGDNLCPDNSYNKHCVASLEMKCTKYENGCTTAGLELSSLPSDLIWSYNENSNILTIGKKSNANYWSGYCLVVDKTIEFNISNLELVELFSLNRLVFDDYMSITLNNNLIYVGPDGGTQLIVSGGRVYDGLGKKSCERSTLWNQYINRDLTNFLKVGKNILKIRVVISGTGQGSAEFVLKNRCCKEHIEKWVENCDKGDVRDKCRITSKVCTKKDYKVKFDGKYILKKCAEYDEIYKCDTSSETCFLHENDCNKYDISNCSIAEKEFIDEEQETERYIYKCLTPRDTPRDCNQKVKCLDGSCYDNEKTKDNTEEMLNAIAMLSTINESVKTIETKDLTMLNGENLKCKKSTGAVAGFKDCCGDENWGNSLSGCSQTEEKLKEKKDNKDCIYIGNYCSDYINLGFKKVCSAKKYSYCCFNNKFSKILGNATRQQGLQTWGDAKNTNCNGILIDNLNKLDFSKIDFTELYDDIKSNVNKQDISNKVQQSLNRLQNGIK